MDEYTLAQLQNELARLREFKENLRRQEEERIITEEQLEFSWAGNLGRWSWHYPSGKVVFNPRKVEVLGYDYESFTPKVEAFTALIHPDDYLATMEIMREHLSGRTAVYEAEYRMRCADGSWRWFYDRGKVVERSADGKPVQLTGIVFDVTVEKERKKELEEANRKLQEANAVKDRFFSIIAHDLRSPIGSFISFIRMMQDDRFRPEGEAFRNMVKQLEELVKNTDTLLENLLGWARSQTDAIDPKPKRLVIADIVRRALRLLENPAEEKGVKLELKVDETIRVVADEEMLETVIRNLVSNGIKFTPSGGTVSIEALRCGEEAEIRVVDCGVGMDEERINRLFDIGSIFSSPGTANERGHGLGLQICNEFVKKNGGELRAKSAPGSGSTFFFSLPLAGDDE